MKGNLFQHEMSKTSAVFGRKNNVRVVFKGNDAKTDGETIYLPSLDANTDVDENTQAIMRGYTDHEAGHVRHSDFEALADWQKRKKVSKLERQTHNALEDIWLEKRVLQDYSGARKNIRATAHEVNKQFLDGIADPSFDKTKLGKASWVGPVAITWEGRKDYGTETCEQCLDQLPDRIRMNLPKYIRALDHCENSADVIRLAEVVAKNFSRDLLDEDDFDEENPFKPKGKGTPCEDGEGGEGEDGKTSGEADVDDGTGSGGEASLDNPEEPRTGGDGDSDKPTEGNYGIGEDTKISESGDSNTSSGGGIGSDGTVNTGEDEEFELSDDDVYDEFDLSEVVEKHIRANQKGGGYDTDYRVFDSAQDKLHTADGTTRFSKELRDANPKQYDICLEQIAGSLNVMRRKLERCLVAELNRDWHGGMENGRLDTRRLVSAYNGRPNVFKTREDRPEIDTALTLLIDLSGSMYGKEAQCAQQVAIAIAESIDRTGCKYEILGFNNRSSLKITPEEQEEMWSSRYDSGVRYEPLDTYVFKSFDDKLFNSKGRLGHIHEFASGNNSDACAVITAGHRLQQRNEKRKIFITLSDGFPACSGPSSMAQNLALRNAVDHVETFADVIGIGIYSDAVEQFYPKHIVVKDIKDLEGVVMDKLGQALLGKRFVVDNAQLLDVVRA